MRTNWNQSINKEMLTEIEQGPGTPTSLEQKLEKNPTIARRQIFLAAVLPFNSFQLSTARESFVFLTSFTLAIVTAHQRVIHTDELFCQSFALMSYLDHGNGIMKGNTPKISVGTKAERQCEKMV